MWRRRNGPEGPGKRKPREVEGLEMVLSKGGFLLNGSPLNSRIEVKDIRYKEFKNLTLLPFKCIQVVSCRRMTCQYVTLVKNPG